MEGTEVLDESIQTKVPEISKTNEKAKKELKIFDYTISRIFAYFVVYSIGGFIIETVFGMLTKGVIESRKSMLYGPFCCIYGLGAICLICIPRKLKRNNWYLFFSGIFIGSVVEYIVSWLGEYIFHVKWWDYSYIPFNINGRICLLFSVFWGILTVFLNRLVNPTVDKWLDKVKENKVWHKILIAIVIFMAIDEALTCFALKMFLTRVIYNNKLDVKGVDTYYEEYLDLYQNHQGVKKFIDVAFSDKKMIMTFPNIKLTSKDDDIILVSDVLKDITPYYLRIFNPQEKLKLDLDLNLRKN